MLIIRLTRQLGRCRTSRAMNKSLSKTKWWTFDILYIVVKNKNPVPVNSL